MPSLQSVVKDLREQVERLSRSGTSSKSEHTFLPSSSLSSSSQSSPQLSSTHSSPCVSASELEFDDSDFVSTAWYITTTNMSTMVYYLGSVFFLDLINLFIFCIW